MSNVMNMIVNMKELESEIGQQDSQMSTLRVDASDLEAVKQVKGIMFMASFQCVKGWFRKSMQKARREPCIKSMGGLLNEELLNTGDTKAIHPKTL